MDKNAIKKYAVWARRELIERVSKKALQYGITADGKADPNADSVDGHLLSDVEKNQRQALIRKINGQGYEQVMEEVAYTWFNRFAALRFMEVNGYLPSHVRVFTNDAGEFKPQILSEAIRLDLDGLDKDKVYELKASNKEEELFKYLLIVQCNALNKILPGMFQRIEDYTELLLPDFLLREGSVIEQMVNQKDGIPESDWTDQVQIIGWLYQYYNIEPKDKVFANLKKNIKITKENIPAATQLFTPDWIVRYMVENSLGRLWLEGHPNSREHLLPTKEEQSDYAAGNRNPKDTKWHYYLEEAEQEPDVQKQLDEIRKEYAALKPEEIRCVDPCSGSGHILCYLFDVLVKIYEDYGYTAREAVTSIIENNLWGLDIDERAAQLSYFAVMMKARQYDRRFFNKKDENGNLAIPQPHVYAIAESNHLDPGGVDAFVGGNAEVKKNLDSLIKQLYDAKEYGSILQISGVDFHLLYSRLNEMKNEIDLFTTTAIRELKPLVDVGYALAQQYDVVVTNPPYMGASNMNAKLSEFLKKNYTDEKSDLFACFISRGNAMVKPYGHNCMVTMQSWMFLSSFEKMRKEIISTRNITNLMHMENMVLGIAFGTAVTVFRNSNIKGYKGTYNHIKLNDIESDAPRIFPVPGNRFAQVSADNFSKIPGSPVAYWVSEQVIKSFLGTKLSEVSQPKSGMSTTDNTRFLRYWYEVHFGNIRFACHDMNEVGEYIEKWYPYNKGGDYRKWYGNRNLVVNWANNGAEIRKAAEGATGGRLVNIDAAFKECLTWSSLSAGDISMRYCEGGFMFDSKGACLFSSEHLQYILGFINSVVAKQYLSMLCPTMDFNPGQVGKIPFIYSVEYDERISKLVQSNCDISKTDWDAFETSWDFEIHPLAKNGLNRVHQNSDSVSVEDCFYAWDNECKHRFNLLKENEEEINRIFIGLYGLENELTPKVTEKNISVRTADLGREIRSMISYAVGCMFGRYSLDVPGLVYAGGTWDASKYTTFIPDKDAIIPICDDEYFEDDIFSRFVKFVEVVYGKETLEENLKFIADALGGKGTSREVIRNYFMNEFYKDHCKIYQKRPIYWLFDSGKKNGFKCLIYMHRYQPDTIARIRTDYVHEQQSRYRTAIADLEKRANDASTSERVKLNKQLATLQAQATELREYEEKIHHLADQMIKIDLDDGVKHNYEIFKDVLAKIK